MPFPTTSPAGRKLFTRPARQNPSPVLRSRVRVPELALGAGLVAAGALGSVFWATRGTNERVLIAARPLHRGEVIDGTSLRWATVSGDRIVGLRDPAVVRGRVLVGDVPAGAPMQEALLQSPDTVGRNEAAIGLSLEPGDFPAGLVAGDVVTAVLLPSAALTSGSTAPEVLDTTILVVAVEAPSGSASDRSRITLRVRREDLGALLGADRVRLARVAERTSGTATIETSSSSR